MRDGRIALKLSQYSFRSIALWEYKSVVETKSWLGMSIGELSGNTTSTWIANACRPFGHTSTSIT